MCVGSSVCVCTREPLCSHIECYSLQWREQCLHRVAESLVKWGDKMRCSTIIYSKVLEKLFFQQGKGRGCTRVCHWQTLANDTALKLIYTAAYIVKRNQNACRTSMSHQEKEHVARKTELSLLTIQQQPTWTLSLKSQQLLTPHLGKAMVHSWEKRDSVVYIGIETFTIWNKRSTPNIFMQFPFSLLLNRCNYKHTQHLTDEVIGCKRKAEVTMK